MALMDAAFLAPSAPLSPVPLPAAPVQLQQASLAGAALATTGTTVGAAAVAAGALLVLRAGRRRGKRTAAAATAVIEEADVPPPPPFTPSEQLGATEPLGFFDPLNFTAVGDERGFNNLRASELKHGRVAMMASVGLLGQHFLKFPGFEKTPAGLGAMGTGEGVFGFFGVFLLSGLLELAWREKEGAGPGNFGDPFGVSMYNNEMRTKEINNGRFAMICVLGILVAELASGKDAIQQFGF